MKPICAGSERIDIKIVAGNRTRKRRVAARIAHRQTGVVTSLDKLAPGHLSELLDEVLVNSTYRANAQKLQRKIVEANGLSVAADVVEEALGARNKPNAL